MSGLKIWTGSLMHFEYKNRTVNRKIFIRTLSAHDTKDKVEKDYSCFGPCKVYENGLFDTFSKRYCHLVYERKESVELLLDNCRHSWKKNTFSFKRHNNEINQILITLKEDNYFILNAKSTFDEKKTIFVGGVHSKITAINLYFILVMFGQPEIVKIKSDEFDCPSGSAYVTFSDRLSYTKAIMAGEITVCTGRIVHKMEMKPFINAMCMCSLCKLKSTKFYCTDANCLNHFCSTCFALVHDLFSPHSPHCFITV